MAAKHEHDVKAVNATEDEKRFIAEHADELSDSTQRAKWIHSPNEKADRDGQTLATRSREVIQAWAEERDGRPATVEGTEHDGRPGVLRIDFREEGDDGGSGRITAITWDDWFRTFEERELVFLYQDRKSDGNQSTFFQLDSPNREDG